MDVQATTTFIEDSQSEKVVIRNDDSISSLGPSRVDDNTIADFLSKPMELNTGTWATTDSAKTELTFVNIESSLLGNQIWLRKLQGYNLIRATAVIRVVLNALPFQQGRLIGSFIPNASHRNTYMSKDLIQRYSSLCSITQLPHFDLDCRDTTAEIEIPFVAPVSHFDLTSQEYGWGTLSLRVLAPLRTGSGSNTVNYSVFMYFKDLELAAPTYVAHSGKVGLNAVTKAKNTRTKIRRGPVEVSGALGSEEPNGFLSRTFANVSNASSYLTDIPLIGDIAGLVSSGSGLASNLLSAFGYSKPLNTALVQPFMAKASRYTMHANPQSNATSFALNANSKLEPITGFAGSTVDEMSINYLKAIPAYITSFDYSTTAQPSGTDLYTLEVSPMNMYEPFSVAKGVYRSLPPAFWLANHFQFWRGSIDIHLRFIKTIFQSGRLLVTFTPHPSASHPTNPQSAYSIRQIIDLREKSEFTINIPYMRNTSYLKCDDSTSLGSLGTFNVAVLNPLVASDTVSSDIECLVYANGGADFELAVPMVSNGNVFYPESGVGHNETAIGDPVQSIKQLISRTALMRCPDVLPVGQRIFMGVHTLAVPNVPTLTGIPEFTSGRWYDTLNTKFYSGFAYIRGGKRIFSPTSYGTSKPRYVHTIKELVPVSTCMTSVPENDSTYKTASNTDTGFLTGIDSLAHIDSQDSATLDVVLPGFSQCPQRINYLKAAADDMHDSLPDQVPFAAVTNVSDTSPTLQISAADDLCLGYFIGFLPLFVTFVP